MIRANFAGHGASAATPLPRTASWTALDASELNSEEPLAAVMGEVVRQLGADCGLLAWRDVGCEPLFMLAHGAHSTGSCAEQQLLEEAAAEVSISSTAFGLNWVEATNVHGDLLTCNFPAEDGVFTISALFRGASKSTVSQAKEIAGRVSRLVQPLFRLWISRLRVQTRERALAAALNDNDVGFALLDRNGHLLYLNKAANVIISRNDGLRLMGASLGGAKLSETLRLQAAIEHVINVRSDPKLAATTTPVVALERSGGRPLMVSIGPCDTVGAASEAAAAIYIYDPDLDLSGLIDPVCRYYRLSPVETRLACLIAEGKSLSEASSQMAIREQTARSYLKQIFLKTDTNRQGELVCLLLRSRVRAVNGNRPYLI